MMCEHRIREEVKRSNYGRAETDVERAFACEAYAMHSAPLHKVLLRVVECADCTDHVLVHTFLITPARNGVQPTFAELVRAALAFICGATEEGARKVVQARIRAWYLDAQFERSSGPLLGSAR
jgi:hypothetical protein